MLLCICSMRCWFLAFTFMYIAMDFLVFIVFHFMDTLVLIVIYRDFLCYLVYGPQGCNKYLSWLWLCTRAPPLWWASLHFLSLNQRLLLSIKDFFISGSIMCKKQKVTEHDLVVGGVAELNWWVKSAHSALPRHKVSDLTLWDCGLALRNGGPADWLMQFTSRLYICQPTGRYRSPPYLTERSVGAKWQSVTRALEPGEK